MNLRPDQNEVCKYKNGLMAVPSIPGAGKTFTLAVLASQIIKEDLHSPGKILIVTYMNSAVSNFKTRISNMLQQQNLPKNKGFEVMTIHSLAMKVIKEKPSSALISEDFEILEDITKDRILHRIINNWISGNPSRFYSFIDFKEKDNSWQRNKKIDTWLKKFNRVANEMIPYFKCKDYQPKDLLKDTESEFNSLLRCVAEVYSNYDNELKTKGLLDFNDIICIAIKLLKEDSCLQEKFQKKYTYIFEDEAQDSSSLQEDLLFLISGSNKNLVRVGDINQSIMSSFTVSDPKLFKRFCTRDDVVKRNIGSSSRNTKDIINLANFLVEWSTELHPLPDCRDSLENQKIHPVLPDDPYPNPVTNGYTIGTRVYETLEEEIIKTSNWAVKFAKENPDKTIAILVPTNYSIEEYKVQLQQLAARFNEVTNFPSERSQATNIIGTLLSFISKPYDNTLFSEVLGNCFISDYNIDEKYSSLKQYINGCYLEDLLYPERDISCFDNLPDEISLEIDINNFKNFIEKIKLILEARELDLSELVILIADLFNFDSEKMAIAQKISSNIRFMISLNPDWGIKEIASELKAIKNSLNYFANIIYERKGFEPEKGVINLLTYHKSKGLEFDTVYLTGMTSSDFPADFNDKFLSDYWCLKPYYRNPVSLMKHQIDTFINKQEEEINPGEKSKIEIIGERLRLLYVGITRAKENLVLSSYKEFTNKEMGKRIKTSPTQYLNEISRFILESRKSYEK